MKSVENLTSKEFADRLLANGVPVPTIRIITGLTHYMSDTTPVEGPSLAPSYGAQLHRTLEPTTEFEKRVKDAGHFKTITDAAESIAKLEALRIEAIANKDVQAFYTVLNRALIIACRANMNNKPDQGRMFSDWLANTLLN